MPDDILEQEFAEQPDPDAMAGFELGAKDEAAEEPGGDKKDESPAVGDKPPEKDEKPPEAKPEEGLSENDEPKKEEDLTAKDRMDRRVKELGLPPQEETLPKKEEPPELAKEAGEEKLPPEETSPASRLTKEQVADHLKAFSDDNLPEETVIIGDEEVNLKEFAEDYPEQFAAVKVLSSVIAQQAIDKALKGQKPDEGIQERLNEQDAIIRSLLWWESVQEKHSDAKQVKANKGFQEWFDKQPDNVKRFGAEEASPGDAVLLLDFYKEDIAKKSVKKHDTAAADKKKQTDDLHKGTMRAKNDTSSKHGDVDMDDDEAGFEEGLRK